MNIKQGLGYTEEQLCLIYGLTSDMNVNTFIRKLLKENVIEYERTTDGYLLKDEQLKKFFNNNCEKIKVNFEEIAEKMMSLYPSGIKPGTNYNWRGNVVSNAKRLKQLYDKYKDRIDLDLIPEATKKYIESFDGDYKMMRLLPYFIFKIERKDGMEIFESDLMSTIEAIKNPESDFKIPNQDWVSNLI